MVELSELWLPILLSGVAVFFVSFLMWTVLPHHRQDWPRLPDEDRVMDALREPSTPAGQYSFPHCSGPEQWKDPAYLERFSKGPKGFLIVKPDGPESMGPKLATSFLFNVLAAFLVAYLASMALPVTTSSALVFRFVATASFVANSVALAWGPIWFARSWSSTGKEMFDGLVYGLVTGAVFVATWPDA